MGFPRCYICLVFFLVVMHLQAQKKNELIFMFYQVFRLIRPHQWIKNFFIFIPAFFAGTIFQNGIIIRLTLGVVAFSLVSSAVYILNDYKDREIDRLNPKKKFRALATGVVPIWLALGIMVAFALVGCGIALYLSIDFFYLLLVYILLNVAYSFGLKNVSIVDAVIVATGFLLRVLSGAFIADVRITNWLIIMIFLLSLFLAFAKRREDVMEFNKTGKMTRRVVANYNLELLNTVTAMLSGIIIIAYLMYTMNEEVMSRLGSRHIYVTAFYVLLGMIRYMQIIMVKGDGASPTRIIYKDRFILLVVVAWIITYFVIIYGTRFL